jgi:uncharacterized Zn finger protein (UPF0148 family)
MRMIREKISGASQRCRGCGTPLSPRSKGQVFCPTCDAWIRAIRHITAARALLAASARR